MLEAARTWFFGARDNGVHQAAAIAADAAINEARGMARDLERLARSEDPLADLVRNMRASAFATRARNEH